MQKLFCVQTYWRDGKRLSPGQLRPFFNEADAEECGLALRERVPGFVVFSVVGEPESGCWEEPVLIRSHGLVPPEVANQA